MSIAAFGVPVFNSQGNSRKPPIIVGEINDKLSQLGVSSQDVITIQVEQDFYHVFYRKSD